MSNDLRLRVIMDMANKASAPLRNIEKSSTEAAKALKAARDTLKKLNEQQRTVDGFEKQNAAMRESRNKMRVLQQNLEVLRTTQGASAKQIQAAEKALTSQTAAYQRNKDAVFKLRGQLTTLGITKVSEAQRRLKTDTDAANQAIAAQTARLKELSVQQGKLRQLNRNHAQEMIHTGMVAAAGVGAQAAGRGMARPVLSAVQTYAQQESATSQLQSSMMQADGSVSAEFKQINELAMSLGDRLPGTTADFIEMMTMLRRQGLSAQSILGGTGEAAAYLGVQLKMPATAAAEFAAKMQDATRTTERDMMGLMDLIQRTHYMGVDSGNMQEAFKGLGPTMDLIKRQGLDGAKALAPFVVMLDQAGMQGGAAGNAINKVVSRSLDVDQISKVVQGLKKDKGINLNLDFTNGQGEFGGIDQMLQQLSQLKQFDTVTRLSILKDIYGDDKETNEVLSKIIGQGINGYNDVIAKLQAQADLRKRVEAELGTISALWDSASGSFTNVLAAMGQTIAPEVKALTTWLGEVAASTRAWIAEHPTFVGWVVKIVAVVAGLTFILGTLTITLASILGPFFILRFLLARSALGFAQMGGASGVAVRALGMLRGALGGMWKMATALFRANPLAAIVIGVGMAIYDIVRRWDEIKALFNAGEWTKLALAIWQGIEYGLNAMTMGMYGLFKSIFTGAIDLVMGIFGINSPSRVFFEIGGHLINGLVNGITNGLGAVKNAIVNVADSTIGWFREKLGIRSPSRVFIAAGNFLGEGAAIGIQRSAALVRKASVGMAAASAIGMPGVSMAGNAPLRIDSRPPLASAGAGQRAPAIAQGDTITIHINAAPGMDPQAIARAVSAELDKRERTKAARVRSRLSDIS